MSNIIKKYDFIFPIGRFCYCSSLLNNYGLKLFDGPWDWSGTGQAEGIYKRLEALEKGFDGWFNKKDFVLMYPLYFSEFKDGFFASAPKWQNSQTETQINNENPEVHYYNTKTLTYYLHDFHKSPTFNIQFNKFYKQYLRRSNRLLKFIQAADSILLVYMSHIGNQRKDIFLDDDKVVMYINRLRKKYPNKTIDLYIFDHNSAFKDGYYQRSVLDIGIIRYLSNHEDTWPVNDPNPAHNCSFMMPRSICNILKSIELTDKFKMI